MHQNESLRMINGQIFGILDAILKIILFALSDFDKLGMLLSTSDIVDT